MNEPARLVEGALAGTVTAATALVAVSMPKDRLGFGLGMIQTAVFSGSALGPLLGGAFAVPGGRALGLVARGADGRELVPVLQLVGAAELVYSLGLLVGLLLG